MEDFSRKARNEWFGITKNSKGTSKAVWLIIWILKKELCFVNTSLIQILSTYLRSSAFLVKDLHAQLSQLQNEKAFLDFLVKAD